MLPAETEAWIQAHLADDPTRLRLRYQGNPELADAITQVDCRQRCASKLPLALQNPAFCFPSTLAAEQATSEAVAAWRAHALFAPGERVLDLTCGLGIDAFALARRGCRVQALEIDPGRARCAAHNARVLGLDGNITVTEADALAYLAGLPPDSFDTVYADPARRKCGGNRAFALCDCTPDVSALLPRLLQVAPRVVVKASPMLDVSHTARLLGAAVTVVGTPHDCKEVVAVVTRGSRATEGEVEAVTLLPDGSHATFRASGDASSAPLAEAPPEPGHWIAEPWPSVMKTAAWGQIALSTGTVMLGRDSRLFTSASRPEAFPGEVWQVDSVWGLDKRQVRQLREQHPRLNVAVRGLGIPAPQLEKRLGTLPGGPRLFGTTVASRRLLLLCGAKYEV